MTYCSTSGGGIFCDGQFCTTGDLMACAAQLEGELDLTVDLSVTARVDANADVTCAAGRPGRRSATPFALLGVLVGLSVVRVVRNRRP